VTDESPLARQSPHICDVRNLERPSLPGAEGGVDVRPPYAANLR
jgi:hypothetical protein